MPVALDGLRLGREDVESIVARMVADAVAGLDPADPGYPDVIAGTFLHDLFGTTSLEVDRLYDRIDVDLPQTGLPHLTYGEWLDAWAEGLGLADGTGGTGRKDEVKATGTVEFTISATATAPVTIPNGTPVSTVAATEDQEEIGFVTLAELTLAPGAIGTVGIEAEDPGVQGNVPANAITVQEGVANIAALRNPLATANGADVESDTALQGRVMRKLAGGGGPGNVFDYEEWALEEPGVGFVTVQRNWAGVTTVRVIITDTENNPSGQPVIDRLQERLDPLDESPGEAPIGAAVTIATPATNLVAIDATIVPEGGYTLDGAGGTRPLRAAVEAAIRRYVESLPPGADVIRNKVIAAIVDVPGVADVVLNAPAADVAIAALEVAAIAEDGIALA